MKRIRLVIPWSLLAGLVLLSATCDALKGNVLVLNKLKSKPDDTPAPSPEDKTASDDAAAAGNGTLAEAATNSSKPALTGIPQLDYVHDPNLPRELNGYNLKDYPFYDRVPDDMDFKCDGLHDGFYASVPHKCQVYHHCLFGTRYDFLCANYTAFDQKTFICHFVSEVDCVNSPKYFSRNEALYKAATTTTVAPPRTTEAPPPPPPRRQAESEAAPAARRRRPFRRRRPVYDYVYDDEYDDDLEYEDDTAVTQGRGSSARRPVADEPPRRKRPRPQQRPAVVQDDVQEPLHAEPVADLKPKPSSSVYDRPRMAPKIRRPVPLNERDKYDYSKHPNIVTTQASVEEPRVEPNPRPKTQQPATARAPDDDYYYDDEEEYVPAGRSTHGHGTSRAKPAQDYYPEEADIQRRPPKSGGGGSPRRTFGNVGSRKRMPTATADTAAPYSTRQESDEYDDFYDEVPRRVTRPAGGRRRVKDNLRDDDYVRRPVQATGYKARPRAKPQRYEPEDYYLDEDPVPAARPAYISRPQGSRDGYSSRRRPQQIADTTAADYVPARPQAATDYKRPAGRKPSAGRYSTGYAADTEYYDDTEELEEEPENYRSRPKQVVAPARGSSSGTQYQAAARQDESLPPVSKTRPYTPNSRPGGSNLPPYQQQTPQYSSAKPQPTRNYPPASIVETEDRPRLQQPTVYREKSTEEERDRSPGTQRNNKVQGNVPEPVELPARLVPKGFTPQSDSKSDDTYLDATPPRTVTSSGSDDYRRRLAPEEPLPPRLPSTAAGANSYQPKAVPSGDNPNRTPFGKYRSASGDNEPLSIASATTGRATEASTSLRTLTQKDQGINKTSTDYSPVSSRGVPSFPRLLGKSSSKAVIRERENIHIVPEEPLRHNLADVNDNDDDVARNDVLSPSIPSTRSIPSGPAFLKSGDGQPRFRVKLFKSKLTSQFTSQDNPSQSSPKNTTNNDSSTDVELSSSLAGGGGSGGGDSRGYLVTSASQTQYTRAPFPTHSKDIVLDGSASDADDHTRSSAPVSGSFNQRLPDQFSSSRVSYTEPPTGDYVLTPQSRQQVWSQQRKRSSSQYLTLPN